MRSPIEVRVAEVRVAEVRASEVRASEVRASEVRAAEVRAAEVRAYEVRASEVRASEVRASEVRVAEVRAAEGIPFGDRVYNLFARHAARSFRRAITFAGLRGGRRGGLGRLLHVSRGTRTMFVFIGGTLLCYWFTAAGAVVDSGTGTAASGAGPKSSSAETSNTLAR